ncbi:MAG: O-antigen ligase family protein, partial [Actinobacteria bacterium]|nr:O-antigen ligase family protein [Actinomycetota bacterium]
LSRGGVLALLAGGMVLVVGLGPRRVARAIAAPGAGALLALAGLLPSIPASSPAPPRLIASAALALGLATAALGGRRHQARRVVMPLALLLSVGAIPAVMVGDLGPAARSVAQPRLSVASPDRIDESRAALRLLSEAPIAGVGPGRAELRWVDGSGRSLTARYTHNEYLQVLVELGLVGLLLLLFLLATLGRAVWYGRHSDGSAELWAGGAAALTALAVHGLLDFGWHVPAIPLTGALLVGVLIPTRAKEKA